MKLSTEEIKKIGLSVLVLIVFFYCYKNMMLDQQTRREELAVKVIEDLEPKIKAAQEQIRRTADVEKQAPADNETLEQINALIPSGDPITWFPPRMTEFFKRQGIEKCTVQAAGNSSDANLPGFRKSSWSIEIPKTEFTQLAIAVAGLENEEPLLEITNLHIEASTESFQFQHAILTVNTIIKEEKR